MNGTLYILRADGLYAYHPGDDAPTQLMDFTKADISGASPAQTPGFATRISALLSEGGALYALDSRMENLWRFDESASAFVREASFENTEIYGDHAADNWMYSGFLLDSGNIYYIAGNHMSTLSNLMMLNTKTGKTELVKTDVYLAASYAKGMLLVVTGAMGQAEALSLLEPGTDRITQMLALIINPYTRNIDAALAFAEFAVQSLPLTTRTDMMPGENEPIPQLGYDLKQTEGTIERVKKRLEEAEEADKREIQSMLDILLWEYEEQKKGMWLTTPESIDTYRQMAPYLVLERPNPIYGGGTNTELKDLFFNRFLQGQVTPAQFLAELDQKVRMMELEQ